MALFVSTLNQMGVLGFYMILGFVIAKLGIVDNKSTTLLARLENNVFFARVSALHVSIKF